MDNASVWVSDGSAYAREHAKEIVSHYRYFPFTKYRNEVIVIDNGVPSSAQEWLRRNV